MSWTPIYERHPLPRDRSEDGGRSPVDELMDSWVCWREACEDVRSAYEYWDESGPPERALAFESYRAALEREEHAALVHSVWTDRVRVEER